VRVLHSKALGAWEVWNKNMNVRILMLRSTLVYIKNIVNMQASTLVLNKIDVDAWHTTLVFNKTNVKFNT